MMVIDRVVVGGREFAIVQHEQTVSSDIKRISYTVHLPDGSEKKLRVEYETNMIQPPKQSDLFDAEDELTSIVEQEIRMELFGLIHNIELIEVTSGKRPDLLAEYVSSHLDVNYLDPEVQEKYIDVIAEALKGKL